MGMYFKPKMESVIDRGAKMSHDEFAALIEEKIGSEEKDPDMKLWKRNAQLGEVSQGRLDSANCRSTGALQSGR
jgi:hypothetical protein